MKKAKTISVNFYLNNNFYYCKCVGKEFLENQDENYANKGDKLQEVELPKELLDDAHTKRKDTNCSVYVVWNKSKKRWEFLDGLASMLNF